MMSDETEFDQLPTFEPLDVKCNDSDCDSGRHAFAPNRRKKKWADEYEGECRECGAKLVDWDRIKRRDLEDVKGVFAELQHELIRHVFFHADFDKKSREEANGLGLAGLKAKVRPHLLKKVGQKKIWRDGTQTPKKDSAIHFAQHATATCCRKCMEYWHGIERDRDLTPAELTYAEGLVCSYLDLRARDLLDDPDGAPSLGPLDGSPDKGA
jgi:hypothetical protein